MLSLSCRWNEHRFDDGLALAREVRAMGFDALEVAEGTPGPLLAGLEKAVGQGVMRVSSVACDFAEVGGVSLVAEDAVLRRQAVLAVVERMELARRLEARCVVIGPGRVMEGGGYDRLVSLVKNGGLYGRDFSKLKLELVRQRESVIGAVMGRLLESLDALMVEAVEKGVQLAVRVAGRFDELPSGEEMQELTERYAGRHWVGLWYDFGGVQSLANLAFLNHAQTLERLKPLVLGAYVQDVQWPVEGGLIPLSTEGVDYPALVPQLPPGLPLVWTVNPRQRRLQIMAARERWVELFGAGT
jgi:sugar phosphate isomerase/epimerase